MIYKYTTLQKIIALLHLARFVQIERTMLNKAKRKAQFEAGVWPYRACWEGRKACGNKNELRYVKRGSARSLRYCCASTAVEAL